MSEKPESVDESIAATPPAAPNSRGDDERSRRTLLHHVLAWVGIVAGVVFVVAVIFVSGLIAGRTSGGYHGWRDGHQSDQMGQRGMTDDGCPMWGPGGMMGPGQPFPSMMPQLPQRPS